MYPKRLALFSILFLSFVSSKAQLDPSYFSHLHWRMIGPFRGGRTVGATGVPQQPNVFYMGVNNGGIWKTTDYGHTWNPIFDDQSTGSIGDVVVAPANPLILYAASGEGLQRPDLSVGNGIYRSNDAGKTWTHLGLQNGQQIPKIAVDPKDPNRVFVAVLGHPYGPNAERGIYRSTDGGQHFEKVLYTNENVGGDDVLVDPSDPQVVYATMWEARQGPWENGAFGGTNGGVYKSTDGGDTWKKIMKGLPENLVQAHITLAPSSPKTVYVVFSTTQPNSYGTGSGMGLYRSEDGGENWRNVQGDGRPEAKIGGGDLPVIKVDPQDKETLYSASIVLWRSTDGGKNWTGIKGAPGGDDYQNIWINPLHPEIFIVTGDQGAAVTVNHGQTFSSWYNQPTAQMYHVTADHSFPYNIYGGQQESGSVGIASRGNDGYIGLREWHPVGVEEYGYAAPDPLNPNLIYGGKITVYDKRTGQTKNIAPEAVRSGNYRFVRTEPVLFSPVDPKTLFFAGNVLFKTRDGGNTWQVISPDLSRESWDVPASVGSYATPALKSMPRRGVIYSVAPSFKDVNTIWCGTDDGLIHLTKDGGKNWQNVTPLEITSWNKISMIDAGHFDVATAYASVNKIRLDDLRPFIFKTHDGGKSWQKIVTGLPDEPINAVREDPKQKGLLYAASEAAVYVSFDDGGHWQSLRLNMPASSVRDLIVKDDDLVVATHGRGIWVLDNVTALRSLAAKRSPSTLFAPQTAYRVRWSTYTDTPMPPEEAAGENPPDGAMIDYYLPEGAKNVSLEILDLKGTLVRQYSSSDTLYDTRSVYVPLYWLRPQSILSKEKGVHRFLWDLHYTPLNVPPSYPISAVYRNTAPEPTAPWVVPGTYTVKLTVDGKTMSQPLTVKMDPRVKTSAKDLQLQHDLSVNVYTLRKVVQQLQTDLASAVAAAKSGDAKKSLQSMVAGTPTKPSPAQLEGSLGALQEVLQGSDTPPTQQSISAVKTVAAQVEALRKQWQALKTSL